MSHTPRLVRRTRNVRGSGVESRLFDARERSGVSVRPAAANPVIGTLRTDPLILKDLLVRRRSASVPMRVTAPPALH
ncbi:MAG: hypothetical protein K8E66_06190, partial [Phycisphaerales bacterium]|nr:hypothetical protein [Phycisphaerales bacterium]